MGFNFYSEIKSSEARFSACSAIQFTLCSSVSCVVYGGRGSEENLCRVFKVIILASTSYCVDLSNQKRQCLQLFIVVICFVFRSLENLFVPRLAHATQTSSPSLLPAWSCSHRHPHSLSLSIVWCVATASSATVFLESIHYFLPQEPAPVRPLFLVILLSLPPTHTAREKRLLSIVQLIALQVNES